MIYKSLREQVEAQLGHRVETFDCIYPEEKQKKPRAPSRFEANFVLWGNLALVAGWLAIFVMWGVAIWRLS